MWELVKNRIKCTKCGDIIESTYTHDFKWCSCKSVAIDGGLSYQRVVGNRENFEDLSVWVEVDDESESDD